MNQPTAADAELVNRAKMLDAQLQMLKGEMQKIGLALIELEKAKTSLEKAREGDEFLFPIGKFVVGKAKLLSSKYLMAIGGNYYMEMDAAKALEKVNDYIAKTKKYSDDISLKTKEIEKALISMIKEINARGYQ